MIRPQPLHYRIGFLGSPTCPDVPWTRENLTRMAELGFNTMQLHIAWGCRPGDEPLNIEDVVELPAELDARLPQPVALQCDRSPAARRIRRSDLRSRLALCREMGFRTIFHFGAPYNAHAKYGGTPPNCLADDLVVARYEALLEQFAADFPGVDDILVYTYDQDAWLCSEFERCPVCRGVPLHLRVAPFLNRIAARWRALSPAGLLWWSPWELSAGQVLRTLEIVDPEAIGLDLHPNIAETQATMPVDRWFRNTCALAASRGIPVISESFLGAGNEELEPYRFLAHPAVIYRQIAAISNVPGVVGIKEYYGLEPTVEDPNLRMAGLCFTQPDQSEAELLTELASPYGQAAAAIGEYWRHCTAAQELFPWETSWYLREVGKSDPSHSLAAAIVRGQQCSTPAWDSTRAAIFLKTDDRPPAPWLVEDLQLRFEMSAERMALGMVAGEAALELTPPDLRPTLGKGLAELREMRRRAMAYALHLRETNLAMLMREDRDAGRTTNAGTTREMRDLLEADADNQRLPHDDAGICLEGCQWLWDPAANEEQRWPFVTRRFEIGFHAGDVAPRQAALLCVASENVIRVYVNGRPAELAPPGVTPFLVDLTPFVRAGMNTLTVELPSGSRDALTEWPGIAARLRLTAAAPASGAPEVVFVDTDDAWTVCDEGDPEALRHAKVMAPWGSAPWMRLRCGDGGAAVRLAAAILEESPERFLETYFADGPGRLEQGIFSVTSR